jgi:hypothetical protein
VAGAAPVWKAILKKMKAKDVSYPILIKDWFVGKLTVREKRCIKLGVYFVAGFYILPLIFMSLTVLAFLFLITRAINLI